MTRGGIHVLHVFKDAYPPTHGGIEQHVWNVARDLGPAFEATVLTSARGPRRREETVEGVRFVRAPEYGRMLSTPLTPGWLPELRRTAADVVHLHVPNPIGELAWLAARPAPPLVVGYHADVTRNPRLAAGHARVQRRLLARARRIVVSSPRLAATSPALAPHQDRVTVIPFGVDASGRPASEARVAELRRDAGGPVVLFLGRLVHYKGVEVLVEAMRTVDATLVVVGDGPRRPALERAARAAGLGERARFVGRVGDGERGAWYRAASVFVLPAVSRAEAFGIAMLEAMAVGTPVVSTEVGTATTWVNAAGETGLVVPPGDARELARALTTLLADDGRRAAMGAAAARRARERFPRQAMLDSLAALYGSVVAWAPR